MPFVATARSHHYRSGHHSSKTYYSTGYRKHRSISERNSFLHSLGYGNKVPRGYQVDHIRPLSEGGSDTPSNMQLLTIQQHKIKTAGERAFYHW